MTASSFFRAKSGRFVPQELARGYWRDNSLHGRAVVGLLGAEIERLHGTSELFPVRLTIDMFRMPDFGPVEVRTRIASTSRRLLLVEAEFVATGAVTARATCQFARRASAPEGIIWSRGPWGAPHPDLLDPCPTDTNHLSDRKLVSGTAIGRDRRRLWMRERHSIVVGVPLTSYARMALAADYASPLIHSSDKGIDYINSDVSLHLHRFPRGEWLGFEAEGHEASEGLAVGHCRVHDVDGAIGFIACTALANPKGA